MAIDILMPPLSQTMDTLVLVEWLKKTGETVKKGEPLFAVETDKATLEVEALADGVLHTILVQSGDEVKVGGVIGRISAAGEEVPRGLPRGHLTEHEKEQENKQKQAQVEVHENGLRSRRFGSPAEGSESSDGERVFISPRARRLMVQKGIPAGKLLGSGSGPEGAFVERDIVAMINKIEAHPAETLATADAVVSDAVHPIPLSLTRRTIARRMMDSHASIPAVTYTREVDATPLVQFRKLMLEKLPDLEIRPTYTDFLVFIVCRALLSHLWLNATFDGEVLLQYEHVNMALAVDTERGLVAPLIINADQKKLSELAKTRVDLVARARNGQVVMNEMIGGTFTLTNLGGMGIDHFTPIINPPQVAILGLGRIREVPIVYEQQVCIRSVMNLLLTCDHRVIDGGPAARFLDCVAQLVETPELMVL